MAKLGWCGVVVLLSSAALRADTFNFSYTSTLGGPVTASGVINATQFIDAFGLEAFAVTSIYGSRNSAVISPPSGGGVFYWGPNVFGSISFTVTPPGSTTLDTVTFNNGGYAESGLYSSFGSFSISRSMPEPATLAVFLTMGLVALVLARKLPSNKRV